MTPALPRVGLVALLGTSLPLGACGGDGPFEASADQPLTIQKYDGDRQTDTVLATLDQPLRVRVLLRGRPAQGVTVRWYLDDRGETFRRTDASGVASVTWTLGSGAGEKRTFASLEGVDDASVEFTATAAVGQPVVLRGPWSPYDTRVNEQVGALSAPLLFDYWTVITDAHGNLVHGDFEIAWEVTAGGGSIEPVPAPYKWDPGLYARHTLGPREGPNQVTATARGLPGRPQVTFKATGVTALVKVGHDAFASDSVAVLTGKTVGWIWATDYDPEFDSDPRPHDIIFEDDPAPPASSLTKSFGVHTRSFTAPGTYRYRCTLHSSSFRSGHVGMVVVR